MTEIDTARERRIKWWREARFGMFIHWGLYSIPAGVWKDKVYPTGYSEWIMFAEKIPARDYELLAGKFNPAKFDASVWVDTAKKAGMKYIVLTTKHHDGFSMFKSKLTPYNIVDATPFKRDITKELADACREAGIRFGCYYSTDRDWYRPQGQGNRYKQTNVWDYPGSSRKDFDRYVEEFVNPQVEELLHNYQPDIIWFDEIDMKTDAQIEDLYQTIRKLRPDCVLNSRIKGCTFPEKIPPPHCDYISTGDNEIAEKSLGFEWENPGTMNTSYAYNRNDHNWVETSEIIFRLVDIVSKGGNYLLNVGPDADGIIPQPSVDRLMEVGAWLDTNQEAVYGTLPWRVFRDDSPAPDAAKASKKNPDSPVDIRFTARGNSVYAICSDWTCKDVLVKSLDKNGIPDKSIVSVKMLGSDEKITWRQTNAGLMLSVPVKKPCKYAYVYRIDLREN